MERSIMLGNEYFFVDAINIMIEYGAKINTNSSGVWLDTGTFDTILETNRYLLENGSSFSPHPINPDIKYNPACLH